MTVSTSFSSAPVRGIVYMILGGVFMAVNNAMLKWVSGYPPGEVLFLSDTPEEIAAARGAGMNARLIDRSGDGGDIITFDDLF